MENRRSRRQNHMALFLILLAVFFFATAGAVFLSQQSGSRESFSYPDVKGIDLGASDLKKGVFERLFGVRRNDEDTFSYSIKRNLVFDAASGDGDVKIENPAENRYLMAVELTLADGGEVLHRTGYLKPGQGIETLTLEEMPAPGEYNAIAYFCAFDFETLDLLGILEQPVALTVE